MTEMGLMNIIVETLNEQEKENGSDARWERLHTKPVEIVDTPRGRRYRDPKSGKFTDE